MLLTVGKSEAEHGGSTVQGLQPHEEDPALAPYKDRVLLVGRKSRNRALFDEMVRPMEDLQLLQLSPPSLSLSSQEILARDALWDASHNVMHMVGQEGSSQLPLAGPLTGFHSPHLGFKHRTFWLQGDSADHHPTKPHQTPPNPHESELLSLEALGFVPRVTIFFYLP